MCKAKEEFIPVREMRLKKTQPGVEVHTPSRNNARVM